jgi:hypothetical protein
MNQSIMSVVRIRWKKNGQPITPSSLPSSSPPQILPGGSLVLPAVTESDSGVYSCIVSVTPGAVGSGDASGAASASDSGTYDTRHGGRKKKRKILQTVVRIQQEIMEDGSGKKFVQVVRVVEKEDLKLQCEVLPGNFCPTGLLPEPQLIICLFRLRN